MIGCWLYADSDPLKQSWPQTICLTPFISMAILGWYSLHQQTNEGMLSWRSVCSSSALTELLIIELWCFSGRKWAWDLILINRALILWNSPHAMLGSGAVLLLRCYPFLVLVSLAFLALGSWPPACPCSAGRMFHRSLIYSSLRAYQFITCIFLISFQAPVRSELPNLPESGDSSILQPCHGA